MITRKRLQDLSPVGSRVKLIDTATSPKSIIPIKAIKLETGGTTVKTEKTLDTLDYLAKGYCVSAHIDGSACANIQNSNNVNVPPMGIREHRKQQREAKAAFQLQQQSKRNSLKKYCTAAKQTNITLPIATSSPKTAESTNETVKEQGPVITDRQNTHESQNTVTTPSAEFIQESIEQGPVVTDEKNTHKLRNAVTTPSAEFVHESTEPVDTMPNKQTDTEETTSRNVVTETTDVVDADVVTQSELRHAVTYDTSSVPHDLEQTS